MKAVIFGAGNIGRGFIGALMSCGGYEVTFLDVVPAVIDRLNKDHSYPLRIVSADGTEEIMINNVSAINSGDTEAAVDALVHADIVATCVGAKAIKFIIPNLAAATRARYKNGLPPLNLLICENLMDADSYVRSLLENELSPDELEHIGLIETSVGRMVPTPKPEQNLDNPLRVQVERYCVLPVDRDAFKGEIPTIKNMVPYSPFRFYIERKLYLHNMGHAICAYLGNYTSRDYIYEAIADHDIRLIVREAMLESVGALSRKYSQDASDLIEHSGDLIRRFANSALGDTCARVGADIPRKLALSDRLTGAALSVLENGGSPVYICLGAAAALHKYIADEKITPSEKEARKTLVSLTSLDGDHKLTALTMTLYSDFALGRSLSEIISHADKLKSELAGMII